MANLKRVAVLASTAFSATHFIDYLLETTDCEILGISRSPEDTPCMLPHLRHGSARYRFQQCHLVTEFDAAMAALDEFKPDAVVNFAAQGEVRSSFDHPVEHFQTNSLTMVRLTDALSRRDYLQRYVHISTPEVYGACEGFVREDQALSPSSPYAASKASADMFIDILVRQRGFPAVITRATNVYGASQQLYRIIPRTMIRARTGDKLILDGGGVAKKSYIHIRDVCHGTWLCANKGEIGAIYHLGTDQSRSIRSVVETVCDQAGVDFDAMVEVGPERPGQDKVYELDSRRAKTDLGWAPIIEFSDGVGEVATWLDANWDAIRQLPSDYQFKD
jgi:dTDP-glucose 4,6-dehydratase